MKQKAKLLKEKIANQIEKNQRKLWNWHLSLAQEHTPPFYCSVDIRDSDFKIVPVDSNLYPAGFNNLCPEDLKTAPAVFRAHLEAATINKRLYSGRYSPQKILILPEAHTHNQFYIENIYYLINLLRAAGFETELGWYPKSEDPPASTPVSLTSFSGAALTAHPIQIENGILSAGKFIPDVILLNNDFSGGYPKNLDSVKQLILPSHILGWHSRKKSEHFKYYNELARQFAALLDLDPWIFQIDTEEIAPVHFNENQGVKETAQAVERMLKRISMHYQEREIPQEPFVFIKNNHGTYGMGIITVQSADEIQNMNRRTKNKMSVGKNHSPINSVAIQEGIPTAIHLTAKGVAEPVIYLVGAELIGGFLRIHSEKTNRENLNAPGMVFKKFCMSDLQRLDELEQLGEQMPQKHQPTLELVYGSIARLSALATAKELKAHGNSLFPKQAL